MNRGEWRQAAEYFAEDVQHHRGHWQNGTEAIVRGKKALTDNLEDIFRTFPDWKMEVVDLSSSIRHSVCQGLAGKLKRDQLRHPVGQVERPHQHGGYGCFWPGQVRAAK